MQIATVVVLALSRFLDADEARLLRRVSKAYDRTSRTWARPKGYWEIVDRHGKMCGALSYAAANECARLWDDGYPTDAPHTVRRHVASDDELPRSERIGS